VNKTLLIALGLAVSGVAFAQAAAPAAAPDREARRAERQAKAEARFAETDRNRDGTLSLAEWQDAQDRRLAERFVRMDDNKDGQLSREEIRGAHQERRLKRVENRHLRRAGMARLKGLDSNGDMALTRAEIGDKAPRLAERFDQLDTNRDGRLEREELRAGRQAMRGAGR
jgi:Ca2+-binding EF-hand superfamily protein